MTVSEAALVYVQVIDSVVSAPLARTVPGKELGLQETVDTDVGLVRLAVTVVEPVPRLCSVAVKTLVPERLPEVGCKSVGVFVYPNCVIFTTGRDTLTETEAVSCGAAEPSNTIAPSSETSLVTPLQFAELVVKDLVHFHVSPTSRSPLPFVSPESGGTMPLRPSRESVIATFFICDMLGLPELMFFSVIT